MVAIFFTACMVLGTININEMFVAMKVLGYELSSAELNQLMQSSNGEVNLPDFENIVLDQMKKIFGSHGTNSTADARRHRSNEDGPSVVMKVGSFFRSSENSISSSVAKIRNSLLDPSRSDVTETRDGDGDNVVALHDSMNSGEVDDQSETKSQPFRLSMGLFRQGDSNPSGSSMRTRSQFDLPRSEGDMLSKIHEVHDESTLDNSEENMTARGRPTIHKSFSSKVLAADIPNIAPKTRRSVTYNHHRSHSTKDNASIDGGRATADNPSLNSPAEFSVDTCSHEELVDYTNKLLAVCAEMAAALNSYQRVIEQMPAK